MAFWNRKEEKQNGFESVTSEELLNRYAVVKMAEDSVIVSEKKQLAEHAYPSMTELGHSGATKWGEASYEEYNADLRGELGLKVFDKMRRNDGQVKATLRLVKTPVLAARWYMQPASQSDEDQEISKFIWDNLTEWMSTSWSQMLIEMLLMLDFGHYTFEKVFTFRDDKVIWKKWAPRHPMDVSEWVFDRKGGPKALKMMGSNGTSEVTIPISKLLVFTNEREAGNIKGISVLRTAYKHWFYKDNLYKIDAIAKERHGIGIPVIKLPANFSDSDKLIAEQLGRNLRTNEKAHIILPPGWEIMMLKLEGQPVDAMQSAEHHDLLIARNVLGQFINNTGGTANTEKEQELFMKATRFIAHTIRDVINKWAIPELVDYNWNVESYPKLRVRRIGDDRDWRTLSFALRNFVGAGIIIPDERLDAWIRDEMDLPDREAATERIVVDALRDDDDDDDDDDNDNDDGDEEEDGAPEGTAAVTQSRVGLPRQSQAGNQKAAKSAGGTSVGRDRSGG